MKTKELLLSLLGCILFSVCLGQKKQVAYYLKNNGIKVQLRDSADFIRIIQEPDSGSTFYDLIEYYPNNTKKRIGKLSSFDPSLIYEEILISFYPNGKKEEVATFARGKQKGVTFNYYPNGQLKKTTNYTPVKDKPSVLKVLSFYDSTGVQLVKNGTGYYKDFTESMDLLEEGNYLDSLKNGLWKGESIKSGWTYQEEYDRGKFISGVAAHSGRSYPYTEVEQQPQYKGGITKFYKFFGSNYKYPTEAQRHRTGGRLLISFVVEGDGSLTNFAILKDFGYGAGGEAIKVLKKSEKWEPGRHHGIPVNVTYTLPIVLNMP